MGPIMASTAVSGSQYTMVIEDTEKKVNDAIKALTYAQSLNLSGTTAAGSGVAGPTAAGSGVAGTTNSGSTLVKFPEAFTVMESLSKPLSFTSSPALYK
jgi:hypothetical protein